MSQPYRRRIDRTMASIYGPFTPHSEPRAIRNANADRGLRTCWNAECLTAFRQEDIVETKTGSYCSEACALACTPSRAGVPR